MLFQQGCAKKGGRHIQASPERSRLGPQHPQWSFWGDSAVHGDVQHTTVAGDQVQSGLELGEIQGHSVSLKGCSQPSVPKGASQLCPHENSGSRLRDQNTGMVWK